MVEPTKQTTRKTYKFKLKPTPEQERQFDVIVWRCRTIYNTALEQRKTVYAQRGVSLSVYTQSAELPSLRVTFPEYAAIHSQVLQEVLTRLTGPSKHSFAACSLVKHRAIPLSRAATGSTVSPISNLAMGPRWREEQIMVSGACEDWTCGSSLVTSARRHTQNRHHSREADGWYVCFSCAEVPVAPLSLTGRETGIDLGLESFATLADGTMIHNPRCYRKAERRLKTAQRKVSRRKKGSNRRQEGHKAAGESAPEGTSSTAGFPAQNRA